MGRVELTDGPEEDGLGWKDSALKSSVMRQQELDNMKFAFTHG